MKLLTEPLALKIEVPIASFRKGSAREYAETHPVPPPSTVYGMLLSIVGETERSSHCGVKLAIALLSEPKQSIVIRTFRRFKKKEIHHPSNARPDYQELLTDIQLAIWIDAAEDNGSPTLPERLETALTNPAEIVRFGGLSLGESRDLVNSISFFSEQDRYQSCQWLERDEDGLLTLPYWVDHVGSKRTRCQRYTLLQPSENWQPSDKSWTAIIQ